jgi:Mrp family chromosome partitioning ATPase
VDGVLLAIRVCKNGRPAAERAKEMLTTIGTRVLGVIVNGVGRDGDRKGYGYRYYSYYYDYDYEYKSDDEVDVAAVNGEAKAP